MIENNGGALSYLGYGIVDNEIEEYSGYCGMTYLGGDLFTDVYYEESSASLTTLGASTAVFYKQVYLRMYCPSMAYGSII